MPDQILSSRPNRNQNSQISEFEKMRKIMVMIGRNWYFFGLTLLFAVAAAYFLNKYAIPVHRITTTILIEEGSRSGVSPGDELLEGFGLGGSMKNLDNQIMILSSRKLVSKTIAELPVEKDYYIQRLLRKKSFYEDQPVEIIPTDPETFPRDVVFSIKFLGNHQFKIDSKTDEMAEIHQIARFNESVSYGDHLFKVKLLDENGIGERKNKVIFFTWHSREELINKILEDLIIEPTSRKGTVVKISFDHTNEFIAMDFLYKYIEIFLNMSLEKKNTKATRTINFIDEQLIGISDSLIITEEKLQQFRSKHRVMDLSAQGKSIIDQAVILENEQASRKIEADYYSYLSEYLKKSDGETALIAPATIGITDPGLDKLVSDLTELQAQYYSKSLGEKNPMQNLISKRLKNTKDALEETLKGVIRANNLAINDIKEQIRELNVEASVLPITERKLLGIERKYELNNELYTYLIEKRAQAEIQKASNVPDNEIIDLPFRKGIPLRPSIPLNYLIALIFGFCIPLFLVILSESLNQKVKDIEEIKNGNLLPVSGYIPHYSQKRINFNKEPKLEEDGEAFRSLRSRIQFFTKEVESPVILVTSSMPGDGKTSVSSNLAYMYSLLEQKTVLIDFDLRAGTINSFFELDKMEGISTWLIGKSTLEDIIIKTENENLDIISAGPIPPNPGELLLLPKTQQLLENLKERYDYIIIDTAPVGIFSEGLHLASQADTNLLVVRQNQTSKNQLRNTINDLITNRIQSVSFVFNDLSSNHYSYGYSRKYSYAYRKRGKNGKTLKRKNA